MGVKGNGDTPPGGIISSAATGTLSLMSGEGDGTQWMTSSNNLYPNSGSATDWQPVRWLTLPNQLQFLHLQNGDNIYYITFVVIITYSIIC